MSKIPCENCIVLGICRGRMNSFKGLPYKAVVEIINKCDLTVQYIFTDIFLGILTNGITFEEFDKYEQIISFLKHERNEDEG